MTDQLPMPTRGPVALKSNVPTVETGCGAAKWLVMSADHFEPSDSDWDLCYLSIGEEAEPPDDLDDEIRTAQLTNAHLIAAAFSAATAAADLGYDPIAAVEALPELLKALEDRGCDSPEDCGTVYISSLGYAPKCARCKALAAARTRGVKP